jgi:trehalose 6-phosphate synthase
MTGVGFGTMELVRRLQAPGAPALVVVSNREPFVHSHLEDGSLRVEAPAGGLTSALQPVLEATGGTWVAWGSGSADFAVTDATDGIRVPPSDPRYRLRRLRLSPEEVRGFYAESSNRALWPLCHSQITRLVYEREHWRTYRQVNARFAAAALAESAAGRDSVIWIHDYHLAYVPSLLKDTPRSFIHQFWHIPWPPPDILRLLPTARSLVRALLGNDLLGFQTQSDCRNFFASVRRFVREAKVEPSTGRIRVGRHRTVVRAFPISVDVAALELLAQRRDVEELARRLRREVLPHGGQLLLGVDRADYTKGIPRRFRAMGRLLEQHPALHGRVSLLQVAVPSRSEVPEYVAYEEEVAEMAHEVNAKFRRPDWQPIRIVRESQDIATLAAYYRAADVCIVTPLQDGMNLVAKEFMACQAGRLGVLVLSRFAGAAREMRGALLVNPYDVSGIADAVATALALPPDERERRAAGMRKRLSDHTIYDWLDDIFTEVERLRRSR